MFPERFNNKTNGVTPRRWLLMANPMLASTITAAIGDGWVTDLGQVERLRPFADEASFRDVFRQAKRDAKARFVDWLKTASGETVDPDSIFDCHIKRIHEYKRQLLNALRVIVSVQSAAGESGPRDGAADLLLRRKAAPAYHLAKLIIKFINNLAEIIDGDPLTRGRLKVVFIPEYCVSLAERLIPGG